MRAKSTHGFTLIELIIAVAIVGILASIGVSGWSNAVRSTREAEATGIVEALVTAQLNHHSAFDTYIDCEDMPRSMGNVNKETAPWPAAGADAAIASWQPPGEARGSYYCVANPRSDVDLICGGVIDGDGDGTGTAYASAVVTLGVAQATPPQSSLLDWIIPAAHAAGINGSASFTFEDVDISSASAAWITSEVLARVQGGAGGTNTSGSDSSGASSSSDSSSGSSSSGGSSGSSSSGGSGSAGSSGSSSGSGSDDSGSSGSRGRALGHYKDKAQGLAIGHDR
jgi:prepilin-type N-terminal cleavage/methylation domain-containing protein